MLQRLLAGLLGLVFLVAAFVFASIALGVLLAAGLVAWAWIAWRSRSVRQGTVIEGDYSVETRVEQVEDLERR